MSSQTCWLTEAFHPPWVRLWERDSGSYDCRRGFVPGVRKREGGGGWEGGGRGREREGEGERKGVKEGRGKMGGE